MDVAGCPSSTPGGGLGDAVCKQQQFEVLRFASWLSPDDGVVIDISPGSWGITSLRAMPEPVIR